MIKVELNIGNGAVVWAERSVGSGLAATAVATVPLWASLFAGVWGVWPQRLQWIGLVVGFIVFSVLSAVMSITSGLNR